MKSYSSREIIRVLEENGWYLVRTNGDHYQFKHPTIKGLVTVQHPVKDLDIINIKSIEKQSGIKF